jgi:hypothetical protein
MTGKERKPTGAGEYRASPGQALISDTFSHQPLSILPDYSRQALTYDSTRSANPSVLAPLRRALRGAPGRRLADIGGGTGNYALALQRDGWRPLVLDRSSAMLARRSEGPT